MFVNTHYFVEEATRFKKEGVYCKDPFLSPAWHEHWNEQLRRCIEGYSVGGVRITGDHYGYLNFSQIQLTHDDREVISKKKLSKGRQKIKTFPDFWDEDYHYFNAVDQAREEGKHLIVAKARRKGMSYKSAFMMANRYNTVRDSVTLIGAFDSKYLYPEGTFTMANDCLNFFNEHTGWAKKSQVINKQQHRKASYLQLVNGVNVERGYKSQIMAVTYKDNPDVARGKNASLILLEECGTFDNLKAAFLATEPTVRDGIYVTGTICLYGTGGEMLKGTADFCDLFYNPETYNLMAFDNIWDENAKNTKCGYYIPDYSCKPGFIDKDGNSDKISAKVYEESVRDHLSRTAKDKKTVNQHVIEYSFKPSEAFLQITGNIFDILSLKARLAQLEATERIQNLDLIGDLVFNDQDKVKWKLNPNLRPIKNFPLKADDDAEGCILIYEPPYEDENGEIPYGMYLAAIDPYDQDKSDTGSLGSTLIYNKVTKRIVAEYSGRPATAKMYYENVRKLLLYYNARALYENDKKGIFDYFEERNSLYLLIDQPSIINDVIQDSKVERRKGMHMTDAIRDYGEELIKIWLMEQHSDDKEVLNLHKIRCIPLLKELIAYNDDINTDRVDAMIFLMYHLAEVRKQKVMETRKIKTVYDDPFWSRSLFKKRLQGVANFGFRDAQSYADHIKQA